MEDLIRQLMNTLRDKGFRAPARLAIMLYLLVKGKALFSDILVDLDLSPGNLWSHLRRLEAEGLVKTTYIISDRPRVMVSITDKGIDSVLDVVTALNKYIEYISKRLRTMGEEREDVETR